MLNNARAKSGFTLVELLVVILIIVVLSMLVYVSLEDARAKGRDTRRLADIHMIRQALELYKEREGEYPVVWPPYRHSLVGPSGRIYLAPAPSDPKTKEPYQYSLSGNGYRLVFNLELDSYNYPAGENEIVPLADD